MSAFTNLIFMVIQSFKASEKYSDKFLFAPQSVFVSCGYVYKKLTASSASGVAKGGNSGHASRGSSPGGH